MKYIHGIFLFFITVCTYNSVSAQCTGGCPPGSITSLLPAGATTITPSAIYCISTTADLRSSTFVLDGTMIIQPGCTVTLSDVTLNKTGKIIVKTGGKLIITGILTGNSTAPASTIDNIVICTGGFFNITGSFSQGQINIALNDFAAMQVTGAWTAGSTSTSVKIGNGSLIELCSSFSLNKDGFFFETSTGVSYLVAHAAMMQNVPGGFLSSLQNASHIKWTSVPVAAFVSHPAAFTCNGCGNFNLAPPGTTSTCGSAADAVISVVLSIPGNKPVSPPVNNTNNEQVAIFPNPVKKYILLQLPKGHTYTAMTVFNQAGQRLHQTIVQAGTEPKRYELPAHLPRGLYFIQLTGKKESLILRMAKE